MSDRPTGGGERICRTLEALGATCVFGLPGTQNVELFEALRRSRLRTVLATHELAAAFMANGWARATGQPGVLFTIPGPGFAYTIAGLAEARLDSAPLLHVVGQPARGPGTRFQHQAIAQQAMVAPLVKRVIAVEHVDEVGAAVAEAWYAALSDEPGPVVLHLGPDVVGGTESSDRAVGDGVSATPVAGPTSSETWQAALSERIRGARRPLLFVGQGAADAAEAVRSLAHAWPVPVATTLSGRGVVAEDDPWCLAWEGLRSGPRPLNELIAACDLVLVIGAKLSHNGSAGFALDLPPEKLVHADPAPEVLGANYPANLLIRAPAAPVLEVVAAAVSAGGGSEWRADEVADWRTRLSGDGAPSTEPRVHGLEPPTPAALFARLRRHLDNDAIVVTDSGLHQYLVRRHFEVRTPRGLITPADFQSMGFGLPAAIGAALARPERQVVAVIGDGGLAMSAMELLTAAREDLRVTLIVFNDGQLNLIRHQQVRDWGHTHAVRLENPDMEALADALGVAYYRLDAGPDDVLSRALAERGPALLEVRLGDSPSFRTLRATRAARAAGRRLLGPAALRALKRLLGRG